MIGEYAMDQWTVTVGNIKRRIDRYEKKAELKRMYKQQLEEENEKLLRRLSDVGSSMERTSSSKSREDIEAGPSAPPSIQIQIDATPKRSLPSGHRRSSSVIDKTPLLYAQSEEDEVLHPASLPAIPKTFVQLSKPAESQESLSSRLFSSVRNLHRKHSDIEETSSEEEQSSSSQTQSRHRRVISGLKTFTKPKGSSRTRHR
jgi:hypothetical protein